VTPISTLAVMRVARALGGVGRVMITTGVLILLFVAYQLWGTGLQTAQAQNKLEDRFARQSERLDRAEATEIPDVPAVGEWVGRIRIPSIGLDWIFLEGVGLDVLKDGPGHYEGTPLPGQKGNAAIAGHRTTYGQPFHRLDELSQGDRIRIDYATGATFRYEYRGTEIVSPDRVDVLEDKGDDRLTLTACHPKFSAAERIVVRAVLIEVEGQPPPPATVTGADTLDTTSLDGEGAADTPAILWGLAAAMIWFAAWAVGRAWRRVPAYAMGLPLFLGALFVFFENFSRLLPAAY
jgi:sortase A